MFSIVLIPIAALMIFFVAVRGLLPKARLTERLYTAFAGTWSVFGAAIYHPAWLSRFLPVGWAHTPIVTVVFGFGLLALGAYGASMMMGGR